MMVCATMLAYALVMSARWSHLSYTVRLTVPYDSYVSAYFLLSYGIGLFLMHSTALAVIKIRPGQWLQSGLKANLHSMVDAKAPGP